MPDERPNIVLVISHDTGTQLGCYGAPVETPNIDRIASTSVRFMNHFCAAPQCTPSRGSILTGKFPHSNGLMGLTNYGWNLPEHNETLPKALTSAGYSTHLIGLQYTHADAKSLGYEEISDRMDFPYLAEYVIPKATQFLDDRAVSDIDQPFFLSVGVFETHRPFPHAEAVYDGPIPDFVPDNESARRDFTRFRQSVEILDKAVGTVFDTLLQTGFLENTLFIFTVDHGPAFARAKCTLYDPGLRTPLLVHWPGHLKEGSVINELVSNTDILPTVLDLLDIEFPPDVQGRSLKQLLLPEEESDDETVFSHVFSEMTHHNIGYNAMRSVRTRRHKYILNMSPLPFLFELPDDIINSDSAKGFIEQYGEEKYNSPRPPEELYDLENDPLELTNVVEHPDYAEVRMRLRKVLTDWMKATDDPALTGKVDAPEKPDPFIY
jgi:arylsulfatase A-like enzyme